MKSVEEAKVKIFELYSTLPPLSTKGLTEEDRAELLGMLEAYDASENAIADWAAAYSDAERRLDSFELTENEWLYLQAATMHPVSAGLENQLVMNIEETIRYEDPQLLSQDEADNLADKIRNLDYFAQFVLMVRAKEAFAA